MTANRSTDRGERGERAGVVTAEELRDDNPATRGTMTESYTTSPPGALHRDTARVDRDERGERTREVEIPEAYNLVRDRVRWGPIWAGLFTALTSLLLLSLLGLAIGLTAGDAEEAARQGGLPVNTGMGAAVWGAISAILSFLLGGYVAGRTAAVFDRGWGALNGALVFLLAVPVILLLAGQGLGTVLGVLGNYVSGLSVNLNQVQQALPNTAPNATPQEIATAAENARNGAWGTLLGLLLGLGAAALGGALGTRRDLEVDRRTGDIWA